MGHLRIIVATSSDRGHRCAEAIHRLAPQASVVVQGDTDPVFVPCDLFFVVHGHRVFRPEELSCARNGAYCIHDSPLPWGRGHCPTVWGVLLNRPVLGATLFRMVDEVDAGPVVGQETFTFGHESTVPEILEDLTKCYLRLIETHLPALIAGEAKEYPQDETLATWLPRLSRRQLKEFYTSKEPAGVLSRRFLGYEW